MRIFFAAWILAGAVFVSAQAPVPTPAGNTLIPNTYPNTPNNNNINNYNNNQNYGSQGNTNQNFGSTLQNQGSSLSSHFGTHGSDSQTRDQSRNQSRSSGRTAAALKAKGSRSQGKTTVATRKGGAGAKGGGGGKTSPLPDIMEDPKLVEDALFFTPAYIDVSTGDRFVTTLSYYNSKHHKVNDVDLWLRYDPKLISPVWINTDPVPKASASQEGGEAGAPLPIEDTDPRLATYAQGKVESRYWPEQGFIHIHAKLTSSPLGNVFDMADLHWRSLNPALGARIELVAPKGQDVAVREHGKNLVAGNGRYNNQKVNVDVNITPLDWDEPGLRTTEQVVNMMKPAPMDKLDRVRLAIVAPTAGVATGDIGTADIVMINPKGTPLDDLRMRIRFDPETVTILDADEDNYISDGINIFDGDFHEKFPFDGHVRNQVDPDRGIIEYQAGSVMGPRIFPTGTFARIVFRMKRQAGKAFFWFEAEDPDLHIRTTDVTAYGRSLLGGTTEIATQALHGTEIAVQPIDLAHEKEKSKAVAETVKIKK